MDARTKHYRDRVIQLEEEIAELKTQLSDPKDSEPVPPGQPRRPR